MNTFAARDEMRCPLICPKPRRNGQLSGTPDPIRPLRLQSCNQPDPLDLTSVVDLDIFLTRENPMDSTPPFFYGSPPTRSANPIVNDARFKQVGQVNNPSNLALPAVPASARIGCARTKFGFVPAVVRIEGFDCLDHDRSGSRGIPAVA